MKFEYDPFSDPEYLQRAAGYENQIAQMMVGAWWFMVICKRLCCSIKSIEPLQMDMTEQKYEQFLQGQKLQVSDCSVCI